jgi:hypothetical protein
VVAVVMVSLGAVDDPGSSRRVREEAELPYSSNAQPRLLPRIFWSTVLSPTR